LGTPVRILLGLSTLVALAALVAACGGSSSSSTSSASPSAQKEQVLITVTRGDLVNTVTARLQLTKNATGGATGTGQVNATSAKQVSTNQSVTVYFIAFRAGGSPRPSAFPTPSPGQTFSPGGFGGGGGGFGGGGGGLGSSQFLRNAKHAKGSVASISYASNGSATVKVTITKLPRGITTSGFAIAQLSSQVLATNVLLLPTAAISGSGSNATVQLLVNGKTQTQHVVVGKKTLTQAEIVSGVSQGQSVIYTRTFSGRFPGGFRRSGGSFPSGGAFPSGGFGGGTGGGSGSAGAT
jgi:macrolide-specific efflux system membrane fusion protein